MALKQFWVVEGFDSADRIYDAEFPLRKFTYSQMSDLLRLLTAREGLSPREITEATGRPRTALLEVHRSFDGRSMQCGTNPYFAARIVTKDASSTAKKEIR